MLEIRLVDMFFGDGIREVVVITSPKEQHVFLVERNFHLDVPEKGDVALTFIEEDV